MPDDVKARAKVDFEIAVAKLPRVAREALEHWGFNIQLDQVIEEGAEAIVKLNHELRDRTKPGEVEEELADLFIMFHQVEYMLTLDELPQPMESRFDFFHARILNMMAGLLRWKRDTVGRVVIKTQLSAARAALGKLIKDHDRVEFYRAVAWKTKRIEDTIAQDLPVVPKEVKGDSTGEPLPPIGVDPADYPGACMAYIDDPPIKYTPGQRDAIIKWHQDRFLKMSSTMVAEAGTDFKPGWSSVRGWEAEGVKERSNAFHEFTDRQIKGGLDKVLTPKFQEFLANLRPTGVCGICQGPLVYFDELANDPINAPVVDIKDEGETTNVTVTGCIRRVKCPACGWNDDKVEVSPHGTMAAVENLVAAGVRAGLAGSIMREQLLKDTYQFQLVDGSGGPAWSPPKWGGPEATCAAWSTPPYEGKEPDPKADMEKVLDGMMPQHADSIRKSFNIPGGKDHDPKEESSEEDASEEGTGQETGEEDQGDGGTQDAAKEEGDASGPGGGEGGGKEEG